MYLLPDSVLEEQLSTLAILDSIFPLPGELELSPETASTVELVRAHLDAPSSSSSALEINVSSLTAEVRVAVEPPPGSAESEGGAGWALVLEVSLPIASMSGNGGGEEELPPTSISLRQPRWLDDDAFRGLSDSLPDTLTESEADTTSRLLELSEHLKVVGPRLIPLASLPPSEPTPTQPALTPPSMLPVTKETVLCLSKMHHIVNQPKLRRLKAIAVTHSVSGYVRSGKPGVMLYELESKEKLHTFLKDVRGLNYLEFHHLRSTPFLLDPSATISPASASHAKPTNKGKKAADEDDGPERLNGGKIGLVEIDETKELVAHAERVGRKEWFRTGMGMSGGG